MRKHTARAMTWSLSAALAVLLFVAGSSAAVADAGNGGGGRGYVSGARQGGQSANRMGRSVRGRNVRDGRYSVGRGRGGKRFGWFSRDRRSDRAFISIGGGSYRRGYRSSGGFFFGFSFTASEYRRTSGPRYRRDLRREDRSELARENKSRAQRAAIEHTNQSGLMYVPLVASPAAPERLPRKD
jgi:hypothetical protein